MREIVFYLWLSTKAFEDESYLVYIFSSLTYADFFSTSYKYVDSKYGEDIAQLPRSESVSARIYNGILINLNFTKENFTFLDG